MLNHKSVLIPGGQTKEEVIETNERLRAVRVRLDENYDTAKKALVTLMARYSESKSQRNLFTRYAMLKAMIKLTKQFTCKLYETAVSLLLGCIGRWSGREIARSALSLARSAQAERDNESMVFHLRTDDNKSCTYRHKKTKAESVTEYSRGNAAAAADLDGPRRRLSVLRHLIFCPRSRQRNESDVPERRNRSCLPKKEPSGGYPSSITRITL
ncbi:hypothetical protein EVAR_57808_1 [Eumeta japonica]|uniref:Uncharacterized protein n=1 Tax=Eumeta variegata TaxID=151549 RepID=A0A4C1Z9S2_EUMVA|nr:hypothetical protein EVAR_57808_1 [Eumeta japonica]